MSNDADTESLDRVQYSPFCDALLVPKRFLTSVRNLNQVKKVPEKKYYLIVELKNRGKFYFLGLRVPQSFTEGLYPMNLPKMTMPSFVYSGEIKEAKHFI